VLDIWRSKPRRSNVQIMAEMLKVSQSSEVGKTEISSTVNISYSQTQKYLERLLVLKLLDAKTKENSQVSYLITEKGKKVLNKIESAEELLQRDRTR
jgi:predicted transcriptional regulator